MHIGVVGGSGLYKLKEGSHAEPVLVTTPFGKPSGPYFKEIIGSHTVYFLARHGEGHVFSPSEINYRANIFGFKKLGVSTVISISAVGSMRKEIAPGELVLPDQYLDMTQGIRPGTFFGGGVVGHAHFADPACSTVRQHLAETAKELGITIHKGGAYVCIEGPRFSTRAESHLYRSWELPSGRVSVIGMTAMPEARLAREAGLCYQTVAMATDYDCWNEEKGDVSVEAILKVLLENVSTSRKLVTGLLSKPFPACRSHCRELMKNAIITPKELWPAARREELEVILH